MAGPVSTNAAFYRAFNAHDADAMETLWAEEHMISCTHPGQAAVVGRAAVLQSWREILAVPGATPTPGMSRIVKLTEDVAMILCVEKLGRVHYAATNLFVQENGVWRMAHHHAGPMQELASDAASSKAPKKG